MDAETRQHDRRFLAVPLPQGGTSQTPGGKKRIPRNHAPSYRHGTPSGPWPFVDIDDEVDPKRIEDPDSHLPMSGAPCPHFMLRDQEFCWCKYPQALFPNWTKRQQKKSKIRRVIEKAGGRCLVYYVDVRNNGIFVSSGAREVDDSDSKLTAQWSLMMTERPQASRARVVFVDSLTGPILQMLGMRYNIEPFFFSSTIGWIPSRFQSNVTPNVGDHITITLTFARGQKNPDEPDMIPSPMSSVFSLNTQATNPTPLTRIPELIIDTQAALPLRSSGIHLLPDFISLHMIRSLHNSTVISCHNGRDYLTTTAEAMHDRFVLTGKSVYWSSIFERTQDATFLLLSILWYVMYSWDEVFEELYKHICFLEAEVVQQMIVNEEDSDTSEAAQNITQELHAIRAHLMHYESLLEEFIKTVQFVKNTPNPGLDNPDALSDELRETTRSLIERECDNLIRDIVRLERSRLMQDKRLKNVMDLGFSLVNIEDSRRMAKLTEASVRDSAAMKQIAYLTMVFLPSTFIAAAFGMNIVEINPEESAADMTLAKYFEVSLPLTFVTIWVVIAYQIDIEDPRATQDGLDKQRQLEARTRGRQPSWQNEIAAKMGVKRYRKLGVFSRLLWPFFLLMSFLERRRLLADMLRRKTVSGGMPTTSRFRLSKHA
ncbi:hypothetical protein NMY22_g6750 [Coprinellus aureogranulatus]|nr:hypothetical protein NMY22_g6750 [Coprinellus aureogranulatus]